VLNAAGSYGEWLGLAQQLIERCAPGRAAQVLAGTAHRLYRLH
jgi:predicted TIM-barrel fold metal-dependent hydrolase